MEPMPTPAPATGDAAAEERDSVETLTTESVSARIAEWRERVRELLDRWRAESAGGGRRRRSPPFVVHYSVRATRNPV